MKVKVRATSNDDNYPIICGLHEFESIDEALDFVYHAAKVLNSDVHEFVVNMEPDKRAYDPCDIMIEIYDDWRE